MLLEKGANVNAVAGEHGSALYAASQGGTPEAQKLLTALVVDVAKEIREQHYQSKHHLHSVLSANDSSIAFESVIQISKASLESLDTVAIECACTAMQLGKASASRQNHWEADVRHTARRHVRAAA
jgi:hypothetical protein